MLQPIDRLTITVTKTADGQFEYVQVLAGDSFSVNVVLIAKQIVIRDARKVEEK